MNKTIFNTNIFEYSAEEIRKESVLRQLKMSIQGMQPKVSAVMDRSGRFKIVDKNGRYIIKPQIEAYSQVPENETLTMSMASIAGLEVPEHGLVVCADGSKSYFIKRFDRYGRNNKLHCEDFAQLSGNDRDHKYNSSMEKTVWVIEEFCTFPLVEKQKFFKLVVFNYLVGNEDAHLKNFSLIRNKKGIVVLSPCYDLLNSTIVLRRAQEEIALPVYGKKSNLSKKLLCEYFAGERLKLNASVIEKTLSELGICLDEWRIMIEQSFLSEENRKKYSDLLEKRTAVIFG